MILSLGPTISLALAILGTTPVAARIRDGQSKKKEDSDSDFLPKTFLDDRLGVDNVTAFYENRDGIQDLMLEYDHIYEPHELMLLNETSSKDGNGKRRYLASSSFDTLGTAARSAAGDPNTAGAWQGIAVGSAVGLGCAAAAAAVTPVFPPAIIAGAMCPFAGFLAGSICGNGCLSSLFGSPWKDDATVTIKTANIDYADGDTVSVAFRRANGQTDRRHMGHIGRNSRGSKTEDLDASNLIQLEFYLGKETNDICMDEITVTVGEEPSGTGREETLVLEAAHIAYITGGRALRQKSCIFFGDEEGSLMNFKIHWPSALICRNNFFVHNSNDYAKCLTHAMYSYDYRSGGENRRVNFNFDGLPSIIRSPYRRVVNRGKSACIDLQNYDTKNLQPINLINCKNGVNAQLWDYDSDGRLRSVINPTKCLEAGKNGGLYDKVFIWDCHDGLHQKWHYYSSGRLKSKAYDKYLGVAYCGTNPSNTRLELRNYEDGYCGETQKWTLNG